MQPDEAEQGRRVPPRSAVQQNAEFGPPRQQPAAALGAGFELGDQQPRVVGPERLPGELDLFRRRDVEQPAAKLLNLLEQPRVNFLDALGAAARIRWFMWAISKRSARSMASVSRAAWRTWSSSASLLGCKSLINRSVFSRS